MLSHRNQGWFWVFGIGAFVGLFFLVSPALAEKKQPRICYLSFNNEKERSELQKKLGASASVLEFVKYGDRAHESAKRLLESGEHCDGVVLSGHHRLTGFEGTRVVGRMAVENWERWTCSAKHGPWFEKVKVVWLQGCATGSSDEKLSQNDLLKRYQAVFPNALILAWSGSAPAKVAPQTIPIHLDNLGALLQNPNSLQALFSGKYLEQSLAAWEALRFYAGNKKNYSQALQGIGNRTALGLLPFQEQPQAKSYRRAACELEKDSSVQARIAALEELLRLPAHTAAGLRLLNREIKEANLPNYKAALATIKRNQLQSLIQQPLLDRKLSEILEIAALYRNQNELNALQSATFESKLATIIQRALQNRKVKLDEVERKYHYGQLALAALSPLPSRAILLQPAFYSTLKNTDAISAVLNALLQIGNEEKFRIIRALEKNPALNRQQEKILLALRATLGMPALHTKPLAPKPATNREEIADSR